MPAVITVKAGERPLKSAVRVTGEPASGPATPSLGLPGSSTLKISKSDFLLFCQAPRHLWAKKNGHYLELPSEFDQHLINEGYKVEKLGQEYLAEVFPAGLTGVEILRQQTFADGPFEARIDALVDKNGSGIYDLYEIKSSTGIEQDDLLDITFQALVLRDQIKIDHYYLLHPNKAYVRQGDLNLSHFFGADDVTGKVNSLIPQVEDLREDAFLAAQAPDPGALVYCLTPKDCPCLEICHPSLPDFSIFDIPQLVAKKKLRLLEMGIVEARDIPDSFELNPRQRLVAGRARFNTEYIDPAALRFELEKIVSPIYFLDYETCISAVPLYEGYHPQQQVAFQYSLHRLDEPDCLPEHSGFVSVTPGDPTLPLLQHLSADLGENGTVVVWNKAFEMMINRDMAKLHPEYTGFLEDLNSHIYDLGEVAKQGYYLHPGFKGSWSIKNVLPVMVPELSYNGMAISHGEQASLAWWKITFEALPDWEKQQMIQDLEHYCALDTLAMVEIYNRLRQIDRRSGAGKTGQDL
jgi:hypothetical protein